MLALHWRIVRRTDEARGTKVTAGAAPAAPKPVVFDDVAAALEIEAA